MTASLEIEKTVCRQCYAVLDLGDSFCRHCGAPLGAGVENPETRAEAEPDRSARPAKRPEGHGMMLAGLLLLLGPLALPVLWRSRRFPTAWKIILTAVMLAVMVLIVGLMWYVSYKSLEPLRQLQELQGR